MDLYTADAQTLASFFDVAGAGVVVFDVRDEHAEMISANGTFGAMYAGPEAPSPIARPRLNPEMLAVFEEHAIACARQATPIEFEHPLPQAGGERWQRIHMIPVAPERHGSLVRIFAIAVDATARHYRERELHLTFARLKSIFDSSCEGIITIDSDQRIRSFNQAAAHIFGYDEDELAGQALESLIPERFRAQHPAYVVQFRHSPDRQRSMGNRVDISCLRKDGSEFMSEISIAKIDVGGTMEFTAFIRDVSEQLRLMEELHLRASTDPLTGLNNRRHMAEEAEKELSRARRFSHPTTVMLIDLDDFKSINDQHGHDIGDRVLREAARVCKQQSRRSDIIARWGGEEFLMLLPETDTDGSMHLAQRILEDLHRLHDHIPQLGGRPITASIGVAMDSGEDGFDAMVYRADQAMYTAKNSGKNRVVLAN